MKNLLNNLKKISIGFVALVCIGGGCSLIEIPTIPDEQDVLRLNNRDMRSYFIAHAGGSVYENDEYITGTNSLESFENAYSQGFRYFEFDFSLTKDGQLVVFHSGAESRINSDKKIEEMMYDEFMTHKFFNKYTLLDITDIIEIIKIHPDIFIITDFKSDFDTSLTVLNEMSEVIRSDKLKQHFIIQMYSPEQINILKKNNYSNIIFTLYRTDINNDAVIAFIKKNPEVDAITMWWNRRYTDEFADRIGEEGLSTYVHTVNDTSVIYDFVHKQVGVYTDYIDVNQYMKFVKN